MLTKILFTLLVIIVVALIFKTKTAATPSLMKPSVEQQGSLSVKAMTYFIIGILLVLGGAVFVVKYQADNRIVTIKIISEDGADKIYQAKQKAIKGRNFTTLDNTQVTLGESDRVEMVNQ